MEAFLARSNFKTSPTKQHSNPRLDQIYCSQNDDDASTDIKLATLASLFPYVEQSILLDFLISKDGSVDAVIASLSFSQTISSPRKRSSVAIGHQSSLSAFRRSEHGPPNSPFAKRQALTRKGQTLHLYSPADIAAHTPCSIVHNFLPVEEADKLLKELLEEAPTFGKQTFKLFDNGNANLLDIGSDH